MEISLQAIKEQDLKNDISKGTITFTDKQNVFLSTSKGNIKISDIIFVEDSSQLMAMPKIDDKIYVTKDDLRMYLCNAGGFSLLNAGGDSNAFGTTVEFVDNANDLNSIKKKLTNSLYVTKDTMELYVYDGTQFILLTKSIKINKKEPIKIISNIEHKVKLNAVNGEKTTMLLQNDYDRDNIIVQPCKFIKGSEDNVQVLKDFNNDESDNFFYNENNIELNGTMHFKLTKPKLKSDGEYEYIFEKDCNIVYSDKLLNNVINGDNYKEYIENVSVIDNGDSYVTKSESEQYSPYAIIDKTISSYWCSGTFTDNSSATNPKFVIKFKKPIILDSTLFFEVDGSPSNYGVLRLKLYGVKDDNSETLIYDSGEINDVQSINFENNNPYKKYRIELNSINKTSRINIKNLNLIFKNNDVKREYKKGDKIIRKEDFGMIFDSNKELIVASGDIPKSVAGNIDSFSLTYDYKNIDKNKEEFTKMVFSLDKGKTWYSNNFERLNIHIPLKPYNSLSELELAQWDNAKNVIYKKGMTPNELAIYDFDKHKSDTIRFAYVIYQYYPFFGAGSPRMVAVDQLSWQFDAKGHYEKMKDEEYDFSITKNMLEFTPKIDSDLININIIKDITIEKDDITSDKPSESICRENIIFIETKKELDSLTEKIVDKIYIVKEDYKMYTFDGATFKLLSAGKDEDSTSSNADMIFVDNVNDLALLKEKEKNKMYLAKDTLELFVYDGKEFKILNAKNKEDKPSVNPNVDVSQIEHKVKLNAKANETYPMLLKNRYNKDNMIIQPCKLIQGEQNTVEILKEFNNEDGDNFFYNKDNVELDGSMHIKVYESKKVGDKYDLIIDKNSKAVIMSGDFITNDDIKSITSNSEYGSNTDNFRAKFILNDGNGAGDMWSSESSKNKTPHINICFKKELEISNLNMNFILGSDLKFKLLAKQESKFNEVYSKNIILQHSEINKEVNHSIKLNNSIKTSELLFEFNCESDVEMYNFNINKTLMVNNKNIDNQDFLYKNDLIGTKLSSYTPFKIMLNSNKELILANNDIPKNIASNIDWFKLKTIHNDKDENVKVVFSTDKGQSWMSDTGVLSCQIPLKEYGGLSEDEKKQWNKAKDEIFDKGMSCKELEVFDFNKYKSDTIRFAYVIYQNELKEDDSCDVGIDNLSWQFDAQGHLEKMNDSEYTFDIAENLLRFTPKIDSSLIDINIIKDIRMDKKQDSETCKDIDLKIKTLPTF